MSFTTYTELRAAIATRLSKSGLSTEIVDYITLAEKRINRLVKLTAQETETTLTASIGSRNLTLPSLFGDPLALYLTTDLPRAELVYMLPNQMQVYSDNGPASSWTIDGTVIKTDSPADQAYTYAFRYRAKYDLASTETNQLLTDYPDLYFYGALIEAGDRFKDNNAMARYESRFQTALNECMNSENKRRSLTTLRTELSRGPRSNILIGP